MPVNYGSILTSYSQETVHIRFSGIPFLYHIRINGRHVHLGTTYLPQRSHAPRQTRGLRYDGGGTRSRGHERKRPGYL